MRWVRYNMHNNARLDNELAALTDCLLRGEDVQAPPELDDLVLVVRQLNEMIRPGVRPDPAFRDHLTQRLNREWTVQHQRQKLPWHRQRLVQLTALAAAVCGILLVVGLLAGDGNNETVQGTALGSITGVVVMTIGVLVGLGLLMLWYYRRQKL